MFRNGGGQSPAKWLSALPSGARVELDDGAIWVKQQTRWLVAGVIGQPFTSRALVRRNRGRRPTQLVPVGGVHRGPA